MGVTKLKIGRILHKLIGDLYMFTRIFRQLSTFFRKSVVISIEFNELNEHRIKLKEFLKKTSSSNSFTKICFICISSVRNKYFTTLIVLLHFFYYLFLQLCLESKIEQTNK